MGVSGGVVARVEPFLRWAGGKRWLVHKLPDIIGDHPIRRYHEPFLGGGSVFFGIEPTGSSFLSDLNGELVETYTQVRDHPAKVAAALAAHPNVREHYYRIRDHRPSKAIDRAARFIFLNHSSFNGIYRVNLNGKYNVPFGSREHFNPPVLDDLLRVAARLADADITAGDFEHAVKRVRKGDLVFLDPPYTVAHNNNGFVKYNQKLFSFEDQRRLRACIDHIKSRKGFYILTNAAHQSISELFDSDDRKLEISRRNTIGGVNAARGTASEYLFTNLPGT